MENLRKLKGLLFDKDGTLIDIHASWLQPIKDSAALVAKHAGRPELANQLLIDGGYHSDSDSWTNDSIIAFETTEAMLECWSRLTSPALIQSLLPQFQGLISSALDKAEPVVKDIEPLFESLAKHYTLGVASMDDEHNVKQTLQSIRLYDSIDFYCGADSGFGHKPGTGMLHAFCKHASLSPENIAVIGDASHDLKMANAAGAVAIAVLSGASNEEALADYADYVFTDIGELCRHLL